MYTEQWRTQYRSIPLTSAGSGKARRRETKRSLGETEAEAATQSTIAGTAAGGAAAKQLLKEAM